MRCGICLARDGDSVDYTNIGMLRAHQRADHPGEKSPTSGSSRKRNRDEREPVAPDPTNVDTAPTGGDYSTPAVTPEIRPGARPQRAAWKPLLARFKRGEKADQTPTRERRPGSARRSRTSTAKIFEGLWGKPGDWLVKSGADPGVGRVLRVQAPRAGEVLDRLTRNTVIDRALQPIAERVEDASELGNLFALPALIFVYERNPTPFVELMLREQLKQHLIAMVPLMKRQRAEEQQYAALVEEMGLEPGEDPIGVMLAALLAPPPGFEAPESQPNAAQERTA